MSEQYELDVTPRARTSDPKTSHAAAQSVRRATLTDTHKRVGRLLAVYGPQCDEQIAELWRDAERDDPKWPRVSPSGLRTRRRELVDAGLVVDSGRETRTRSGRRTVLWQLAGQ